MLGPEMWSKSQWLYQEQSVCCGSRVKLTSEMAQCNQTSFISHKYAAEERNWCSSVVKTENCDEEQS